MPFESPKPIKFWSGKEVKMCIDVKSLPEGNFFRLLTKDLLEKINYDEKKVGHMGFLAPPKLQDPKLWVVEDAINLTLACLKRRIRVGSMGEQVDKIFTQGFQNLISTRAPNQKENTSIYIEHIPGHVVHFVSDLLIQASLMLADTFDGLVFSEKLSREHHIGSKHAYFKIFYTVLGLFLDNLADVPQTTKKLEKNIKEIDFFISFTSSHGGHA